MIGYNRFLVLKSWNHVISHEFVYSPCVPVVGDTITIADHGPAKVTKRVFNECKTGPDGNESISVSISIFCQLEN